MPLPRATYRIQLRPGFGFDDAAALADYLSALGVSHVYASPYLQAAAGSTHGYDVVDPSQVNEELGGEAAHGRMAAALGRAGLGQVLDIVPNHMAVAEGNAWWWDVLRNGPASRYAHFFDVDWDPPEPKLRNVVLMPVLGDHYGRELEAGRIALAHEAGGFSVRYFDHLLPVAPRSLAAVLSRAATSTESGSGAAVAHAPGDAAGGFDGGSPTDPALDELAFLARSLERLPEPGAADLAEREARQRDVAVLDRRLRELVDAAPAIGRAIDRAVAAINADPDALDALLQAQNYRLAYWRTAGEELDYRRFFDIDTLAGLRTEDPRVFAAVHARALAWVRDGVLDGLRIDHPDGLRRPAEYFRRLRDAAPEAWIVVEKIRMPEEPLPAWPVDGTTGYDFMNEVAGLFVDPRGEAPLTALWRAVTGDERSFHDVAYDARHDILRDVLASDLNRLANIFVQVCETRRRYRDFTRPVLREALAEVAACFPVYRTYVTESGEAGAADRAVVRHAVGEARRRRPDLDEELLGFLGAVLLGDVEGDEARGLRMRFQQFTGPVAAKGEEDTAFYRYLRFTPLNEVGGDPGRWGRSPEELHDRWCRRSREWPRTMTALSTHDTKRSEDVRARLLTLSELPERWADTVAGWFDRHGRLWGGVERDPVMEYLLYQTLVGAWPIGADRAAAYVEKASREAKRRTSWTDPDAAYDDALKRLVEGLLGDGGFADALASFVAPLVAPGRVVSLGQKLVQLVAPGVPDVYQGTELWDLSLVDPDNRRAVDFGERRRLLERLGGGAAGAPAVAAPPTPEAVLEGMDAGLPKLWVVRQALRVRAEAAAAFETPGAYSPLAIEGEAAEHGFGFTRGGRVAAVVPRLVIGLGRRGGWGGTVARLPEGRWRNVLTGESVDARSDGVEMAGLLGRFPVALLVRES